MEARSVSDLPIEATAMLEVLGEPVLTSSDSPITLENARARFEETKRQLSEMEALEPEVLVSKLQDSCKELNQLEPVKLGVTGKANSGKSSLINSMRDLRPRDEGAAAVKAGECTLVATPYPFPEHPEIELWDLPGFGTPRIPRETYKEDMQLSSYDMFLMVSNGAFTEDDASLLKMLHEMGKPFAIVRTHIDRDIINNEEDNDMAEDDTIADVRSTIAENCRAQGVYSDGRVFLISAKYNHRGLYDFPALQQFILQNIAPAKRQALLGVMHTLSADVIRQKAQYCRALVPTFAWIACVCAAANPIPGLDLALNFGVVVFAIFCFVKVLGLDSRLYDTPGYKAAVFEAYNVPMQVMMTKVGAMFGTATLTVGSAAVAELIAQFISPKYWLKAGVRYSALLSAEALADFLPVIGIIVGAPAAYYFTKWSLLKVINELEAKAIELARNAATMRVGA